MGDPIRDIRHGMMDTIGKITFFWGFSRIMGKLYGLLYLSTKHLTLDEMAEQIAISKGNVSINIRALERWNMVRKIWVRGDRRDFYEAETDFWKIIQGVLKEREKREFDQALGSIGNLRKRTEDIHKREKAPETAFALERLKKLEGFVHSMDQLAGIFLTMEDLKRSFPAFGRSK